MNLLEQIIQEYLQDHHQPWEIVPAYTNHPTITIKHPIDQHIIAATRIIINTAHNTIEDAANYTMTITPYTENTILQQITQTIKKIETHNKEHIGWLQNNGYTTYTNRVNY